MLIDDPTLPHRRRRRHRFWGRGGFLRGLGGSTSGKRNARGKRNGTRGVRCACAEGSIPHVIDPFVAPLWRVKTPLLYSLLVAFSDMSHVVVLPEPLKRHAASPVVASAVVGIVLGVVGVLGIAAASGQSTVPDNTAVSADDAVLGGPEYGSRK